VRAWERCAHGEVVKAAHGGALLELLDDARVHPVLVRDEHRLRRALLAREGVGVLVGLPYTEARGGEEARTGGGALSLSLSFSPPSRHLPRDVLHLSHVGTEDFPVESRILELDAAAQVERELLGDCLRACEEAHARVAIDDQLIEDGAVLPCNTRTRNRVSSGAAGLYAASQQPIVHRVQRRNPLCIACVAATHCALRHCCQVEPQHPMCITALGSGVGDVPSRRSRCRSWEDRRGGACG
jgi:hypothetical protein